MRASVDDGSGRRLLGDLFIVVALAQIYGTVVGDDPAEFWRENQDLALVVSQIVPRQCFVYYARTGEHAREGFLVAQRGQAIAAEDSNRDDVPPGKAGTHWPVTRLCEQMRISIEDLAESFPGGPRIQISPVSPACVRQGCRSRPWPARLAPTTRWG